MKETTIDVDKAVRKKRRALLNVIREACIYRKALVLTNGQVSLEVVPLDLKEKTYRNLDEDRTLICQVPTGLQKMTDAQPAFLELEHQGEVISIALTPKTESERGWVSWDFSLARSATSARRASSRIRLQESFFVPVLLYFKSPDFFPIAASARIIDYDSTEIRFELTAPIEVSEADLRSAYVAFQEDKPLAGKRRLTIDQVSNYRSEFHLGSPLTTLLASSHLARADHERDIHKSIIQPQVPFEADFRVFLPGRSSLEVTIHTLTTDGFVGRVEEHELFALPSVFVAEQAKAQVKFNVTRSESDLVFRRSSTAIGKKTQWFNYLTSEMLRYDCRLQPKDAKDFTGLLLESGHYSIREISDLTLLHGYYQHKWPIEQTLPRTKYRWVARDGRGSIIGHMAGLRVSEVLWGAVDYIGSSNYQGSWNKDFASQWLRVFRELLENCGVQSMIQWTFSPAAGIWTKFDQLIKGRPDLELGRDRVWVTSLVGANRENVRRSRFSAETLECNEERFYALAQELGLKVNLLIKSLFMGLRSESTFLNDFEHDYSLSFKRYCTIVSDKEGPRFLLTFSNCPDWASFNKGHDCQYLIPIGDVPVLSPDDENELLALIKECVFQAGCTPYKVCIVDDTFALSKGVELTNLLLTPAALEYAAQTMEAH